MILTKRLILFVVSMSSVGACASDDVNALGAGGTGSTTDAAGLTDGASDTGASDEGTGGAETGSSEPLGQCDCYHEGLTSSDGLYCGDHRDIVPGCDAAPPCDTIEVTEAFSPGEEPVYEVDNPDAVRCVLERFADGGRPAFSVDFNATLGGGTESFWPTEQGAYVQIRCEVMDNPPELLDVQRLVAGSPEVFAACLQDEQLDDGQVYACLRAGFVADEDDAIALCAG